MEKNVYFIACLSKTPTFLQKRGRKLFTTNYFPFCTVFNSYEDAADVLLRAGDDYKHLHIFNYVLKLPVYENK